MSITNGYATLAEYKAYIAVRSLAGSVGTDTSDDSVIEALIEGASRYIDLQTGRRFWADTNDADYYYQSLDGECVKLPDFKSITTVSVDFANTRSYTALTASDFDVLPDNYSAEAKPIRELHISPLSSYGYFPTCRKGIKVTGKRGWPAIPDDINTACLGIVQNVYSMRSGQSSGGNITVTAAGVVIRPQEVPAMAQKTIQGYRPMT